MPRRKQRLAGLLVVALVGALFHACDDASPTPPECCTVIDEPRTVTVSEPLAVLASASSPGTTALSADLARRAAQPAPTPAERLVYVSLPSGAYAGATTAVIRNATDGPRLTQPMVDGGFDPVVVAAGVGDTIAVDIRAGSVMLARVAIPVPRVRRPAVVRTNPTKGKRDVALNTRATIIFSEPMAPGSLTTSSIVLERDGTRIPGTVVIIGGGIAAEFVPLAPLRPNTPHRLVITGDARDAGGDALDADVHVDFTTGTSSRVPVTAVEVAPGDATLEMGDVLGDSVFLEATVHSAQGPVTDREVIWSSSDPTVAVVSSTGLVQPRGQGTATITATSEGQHGAAQIRVVPIPVSRINIGPLAPTVDTGAIVSLIATSFDRHGRVVSRRARAWESDDVDVATVDQRGRVTGVARGTATITVTSEGVVGSTTIGVAVPLLTDRVDVEPRVVAAAIGDTLQLVALAFKCSTSLGNCDVDIEPPAEWSSTNGAIASVDGRGQVVAYRTGMVAISATVDGIGGLTPVTVMPAAPLTFTALTAGNHSTCGLTTDGRAHCWGDNFFGQLGTGEVGIGSGARPSWTPAAVAPLPVAGGLAFASISAGAWHTCALTSAGSAYCWGRASLGRLGRLGPFDAAKCPIARQADTAEVMCVPSPSVVPEVPPFRAISAGGAHSCAITASGEAYCWGSDWYGAVGDGGGVASNALRPTAVAGGHRFTAVSAGGWHTCGLTVEGKLYCWGFNDGGQLGDGSEINRDTPVAVAGDLTFMSVAAGDTHTCGVTSSGLAYCWGDNYYGQLGDGSYEERHVPAAVPGGAFVIVSAGSIHSCGLSPSGAASCWGGNSHGALGDASRSGRNRPVLVADGQSFQAMTAGLSHTCGLTSARVAYCWGWNLLGQLGDGSAWNRRMPVRVIGQP